MTAPLTLFDKIWAAHAIKVRADGATLLHIDRHLIHDGSSNAFRDLAERKLTVRRPDRTFATPDHYVSTNGHSLSAINAPHRRAMVEDLDRHTRAAGIQQFGLGDKRQGIVHVVGPEQGISQPGMVIVCGDSHTSTHGALGALAFGIGASQVSHALATQTLWQTKSKNMRITVDGVLPEGVFAKDLALAIIAATGAGGGTGHVVEYAGSTFRSLSIEGRLTVCNMSIELGARAGLVAPDETTFAYMKGRPYAPKDEAWEMAIAYWKTLPSVPGAVFDKEITLDASRIEPMVTWGTSPENAGGITSSVPDPASIPDAGAREAMLHALDYMGLQPGTPLSAIAIDRVFIGSCTNSRIEDLRAAAAIAKGRKTCVSAMVVPGSGLVKVAAEAEGLDKIFRDAGFEWREAGCSMCVGMNGDLVEAGERCASTSNRNFVGRQGKGARTHLVSPAMAAAAAVTGHLTDVRTLKGA